MAYGVSEDLFILARARKSHGLYAMPTEYGTECILILTLPKRVPLYLILNLLISLSLVAKLSSGFPSILPFSKIFFDEKRDSRLS